MKYHVGFFTKIAFNPYEYNDQILRDGYNICQSENGKVVAVVFEKNLAEAIADLINKEKS